MLPNAFESSLKLYDPRLSLRWGGVIGSWIVERSGPIPPEMKATLLRGMKKAVALLGNPAVPAARKDMLMKACEEAVSAEQGKRVIIYCKELDNRVFNALWDGDIQRHGLDVIDKTRNRQESEMTKERHTVFSDTSREVNAVIHWGLQHKTTEVMHGKADDVIADAFGKPIRKKKPSVTVPLLDATGVEVGANRKVRLTTATR